VDESKNHDRKLKVVLLSPKGPLYRHETGIFRKSLRACPLTLTTLASLVPPELDIDVSVIDEGVENIPSRLDADLIGMTVITGNAPRAYALAKQYRESGIPVVLGGPHVTLLPDEAQQHADAIVTGYAEETWPQLLWDFAAGQMKSRYVMDPSFSFERMKVIPFPRRELMKNKDFLTFNTFEATRGCIHKCEFCVVPAAWGRQPFFKPVSHVIDDIKQFGAKKLIFYDLNLVANFKYAKELFSALIPLKIKWYGLATVLVSKDPELMDLIVRSGCQGLLIGFESTSKRNLVGFQKFQNQPDDYSELIKKLHDYGIAINGTFVMGGDGEEPSCFDETIEFVIDNKIELPRFSILTPFPGTALFKRLEREQRILTKDWSLYDGQHVVYEPKAMSVKQLIDGHERVWKSVYSYSSMLKRVRLRSMNPLTLIAANLGYRFYSNNLSRFYNCTGTVI
jgi:radical SAM superfamily enzyme YgiQ (UPF0313 family)